MFQTNLRKREPQLAKDEDEDEQQAKDEDQQVECEGAVIIDLDDRMRWISNEVPRSWLAFLNSRIR